MEDNKDKRTSGNDILREAEMQSRRRTPDVSPDETIVFVREPARNNAASGRPVGKTPADLEHTAQIRGGAVIRPLKKQGGQQSAYQGTNQSAAKPQQRSVPPTATPPSQPRSPLQARNERMASAGIKGPSAASGAPRTAMPRPDASAERNPQPQKIQARPSAAAPNTSNTQRPQTHPRLRTENDDFQIDEATYRKPQKRKDTDGAFTDSATSAVMSLVKAVVYIVAIIAVSVVLSVFAINTANDVFKFVVEDKVVTVELSEYATISDLADALYEAGAIKYKWAFKLWTNIKDPDAEFVATGETGKDISTTMNYDYLRAAFKKSTKRVEIRVTIPEGLTVDEIVDLFVEEGVGTRDALIDVINNYDFDYRFVKELSPDPDRFYRLEGYLFPDTYNFYLDSSDEDNKSEIVAISKLLDNFDRKFVSEYYDRAAQLGLTVNEAITLASIIEKETRYADELGGVSSVFHNRLKYKAQFPYINSDATIMYAIAHDTGSRLETMTGKDTSYESPYNTYTNKGLPPGPIANPGINAIKYALYPSTTNYFYFVTDNSGRTMFATTDSEHQKNVAAVRAGA